MKKTILLVLSFVFLITQQSIANGIDFVENRSWKEILAKAKRENKLIFLDAYATWCPPCKYLEKNVFPEESVGDYYNSNFINVRMDMEKGEGVELAERYGVTSYPTLFFINGDGKVVHKAVGALESSDFVALGRRASNPETQYYLVKEKARNARLNPDAFHTWVHEAQKLEDEDLDRIVNNYISTVSYPLIEKDMLELVIDHSVLTGKKQMDELYKNRSKAADILGLETEEYDTKLLKKITSFGQQKLEKDEINISQFRTLVENYYPQHAKLETKKARLAYYLAKEDNAKSLVEFRELMEDADSYKLDAAGMTSLMLDMIIVISEEEKGAEFIRLVKNYKLAGEDAGKEYYKDFSLALLYYAMEDMDNLDIHLTNLAENDDTPEYMIDFFLELLED